MKTGKLLASALCVLTLCATRPSAAFDDRLSPAEPPLEIEIVTPAETVVVTDGAKVGAVPPDAVLKVRDVKTLDRAGVAFEYDRDLDFEYEAPLSYYRTWSVGRGGVSVEIGHTDYSDEFDLNPLERIQYGNTPELFDTLLGPLIDATIEVAADGESDPDDRRPTSIRLAGKTVRGSATVSDEGDYRVWVEKYDLSKSRKEEVELTFTDILGEDDAHSQEYIAARKRVEETFRRTNDP